MTTNKPIHRDETSTVVCFIAGMAAVLMGYSVYSHLKTLHDYNTLPKKSVKKTGTKLEDSIRLKTLAYLTQSHNVNIQSSSTKIILERAMSGTYLPKLIAACEKDQPIEIRSKALPSLQLLTRKENNKIALLEAGALVVLVDALKCTDPDMKEVTQRYVAVAICDLIQGNDIHKYCILDLGVLDPIKRILTSDEIRNNELKYWTLMILYQISLSDPLPKVLIENGFVSLLARMARMTYGNTNMPKFCMQSLVRIAANVDVAEAKKVLAELLDYNIVDLISNCLRGDDVELIYWAAGLMHEFVLKDVAADKFREIKGIHTILAGLLSAEEMYISRVILRTIKFMAYDQDKFRHEMVRSGMVKKIMHCLSLDDEDVRYWAILCIHVVAGQVESHEDIISSSEFEILLELALSTKIKVAIFVSDILSLICCISSNNTFMEPNLNLIVKTLNTLLTEGELDVQYSAAGAIFNVMTMTYAFASKVRDTCFETLVLMATTSTHERVQMTCTKGALMVVIKNRFLTPQLNEQVTEPLIETVTSLSSLISPVLMVKAIIHAAKDKSSSTRGGYSISDVMNFDINDDGRESSLNPEISILGEDEEEETDNLIRQSDYVDVNEEGTIANASRLDRILKDRERSKLRKDKKNNSEIVEVLTHDDIAYLFDPNISTMERDLLFTKFELPISARNQIVGALTALNVLLENDHVIGNVVTGDTFKNPILNVLDDIVMDIDYIENTIYTGSKSNELSNSTKNKTSASARTSPKPLSDTIRHLVKNVANMTLYPALEEWATKHFSQYPLNSITESKSTEMYADVIQWIKGLAQLPTNNQDTLYTPMSSDDEYRSSGSSDGIATVKRQRQNDLLSYRSARSHNTIPRRNLHQSDSSSDSEDDDDSDSELISIYPRRSRKVESAAERLGETRRKGFSKRALILLSSLTRYASVKQYLLNELDIIPILIYLFENQSTLLDHVMRCLGGLFANDASFDIPESSFQVLFILLWRGMRISMLNTNPSFQFYSHLILSYCTRYISSEFAHNENTKNIILKEIDLVSRSKFCTITYDSCLYVRNDSWTFETVRAPRCAPAIVERADNADEEEGNLVHKYAFEVKLESGGLMQIGWASEHLESDPEGGKGVGDDSHSYGYDGYRAKKWHGKYSSMRTSYGSKWTAGDIITCIIDMDVGEIQYYKNGVDMGIAFYGVLTSRAWYPAVSLATGQQCKLYFGGILDPLKYLPDGCTAVGALELQTSTSVELPPPHFPKTSANPELEESDITDLAKALENMSVHSPPSAQKHDSFGQSNIEPNLKPVDDKILSKPTVSTASTHYEPPSSPPQKSRQFSYFVTTPNIHERNSLPSLYYEVVVGAFAKDMDPKSLVKFGFKSLPQGKSFYFALNNLHKSCVLFVGSEVSEPFPLEISIGDKAGVFYVNETNAVGLTLNGTAKALIYLEKDTTTLPYLPFVSGPVQSNINYGDEAYAWKSAESVPSRQHISNYLYRLLGSRATSNYF